MIPYSINSVGVAFACIAPVVVVAAVDEGQQCAHGDECVDDGDDILSLLQVPKNVIPDQSVNQSINLHSRKIQPLARPLFWLHVPKCGTSFINTLIHQPNVCPGLPDDMLVEGDNPMQSFEAEYPDLEPACPGSFYNANILGNHLGMGNIYDTAKGHIVTFLRDPEQRIISSFYHEQHDWPYEAPAKDMLEYAQVVQGCFTRMIMHSGHWFHHAPNICGGPEPVTHEEVTEAVHRLNEGFQFVGLTDQWSLSICLFHTMFGGKCRSSDFDDIRPGVDRDASLDEYDVHKELGNFVDKADRQVYEAGKAIFLENLKKYDVSAQTCDWCWSAS